MQQLKEGTKKQEEKDILRML